MKNSRLIGIFWFTGILILTAAGMAASSPPPDSPAIDGRIPATPAFDSPRQRGEMPMPPQDPLAQPTLSANPDQAELGGQVYYYVCMACHGNRGQGLTKEWIESWQLGDENSCWQSKCHASNHPPEGFELPRFIPAVVSPAVNGRFETALDLYTFISTEMPWQAPGSLTEDEYWQLTAFLVRENGFEPGPQPLDSRRAAQIYMRPGSQPDRKPPIDLFKWGSAAALMMLVTIFLVKLFRQPS